MDYQKNKILGEYEIQRNQRLQVRLLWEDNFFALLVLSGRRSDGFSLGFCAGSL